MNYLRLTLQFVFFLIGSNCYAQAQPLAQSPSTVFRSASPSVVTVQAVAGEAKKQGSAVAFRHSFNEKGVVNGVWFATNAHVVAGSHELKVFHAKQNWPLQVRYKDSASDIAILHAEGISLPVIQIFGARDLQVGTKVFAIGSPLGLERSLSEGLVSGLRQENGINLVQTTAAISPGSSGGALLDERGRLLAITTFKLQRGESLNFAVDASRVLQVTEAIDSASVFRAGYERKVAIAGSEEDMDVRYIESDALVKWMLETRRSDMTPTYAWFMKKTLESFKTPNPFWGGDPEFEAFQAEFLATRPRTVASAQAVLSLVRLTCRMLANRDGSYQFDLAVAFDPSRNTVNGLPASVTADEIKFATGKDGSFTATINRFSMRAKINKEDRGFLNGDCVYLQERKI